MAVTALTAAQGAAAATLVTAGDLVHVTADEAKAQAFLLGATTALADVDVVTQDENRFNLAYKAAHDVAEAMMAAYGYKASPGAGNHVKVGRFLRAVFNSPPANAAAAHLEVMRSARNGNHYKAATITSATAQAAAKAAKTLVAEGVKRVRPPKADS